MLLNAFALQDGEAVEVSGSPTEKAILSWAVKVPFSTLCWCLLNMFLL